MIKRGLLIRINHLPEQY
ncbi:hypothetical protein [Buttiauxella sp. WJP83]